METWTKTYAGSAILTYTHQGANFNQGPSGGHHLRFPLKTQSTRSINATCELLHSQRSNMTQAVFNSLLATLMTLASFSLWHSQKAGEAILENEKEKCNQETCQIQHIIGSGTSSLQAVNFNSLYAKPNDYVSVYFYLVISSLEASNNKAKNPAAH